MDYFTTLKFLHFLSFILIFTGVLSIFISEWQTHSTNDPRVFAEAARLTLVFRNSFIAPGSVIVTLTGIPMVWHLDMGFFEEPWLVGMWGLFAMEFVEANLLARRQNNRTLKWARQAVEDGALSAEIRAQAHSKLGNFTHFFDLPVTTLMVYCGVARPDTWTEIGIWVVVSIVIAAGLAMTVPKRHARAAAG